MVCTQVCTPPVVKPPPLPWRQISTSKALPQLPHCCIRILQSPIYYGMVDLLDPRPRLPPRLDTMSRFCFPAASNSSPAPEFTGLGGSYLHLPLVLCPQQMLSRVMSLGYFQQLGWKEEWKADLAFSCSELFATF